MTHPVAAAIPFAPTPQGSAPMHHKSQSKDGEQDFSSFVETPTDDTTEAEVPSSPFLEGVAAEESGAGDELETVEEDQYFNVLGEGDAEFPDPDQDDASAELHQVDLPLEGGAIADPKDAPQPVQNDGSRQGKAVAGVAPGVSRQAPEMPQIMAQSQAAAVSESAVRHLPKIDQGTGADKPAVPHGRQTPAMDHGKSAAPPKDSMRPQTPEVFAPAGQGGTAAAIIATQTTSAATIPQLGVGQVEAPAKGSALERPSLRDQRVRGPDAAPRLSARTSPIESVAIQRGGQVATIRSAAIASTMDPLTAPEEQVSPTDPLGANRAGPVTTQAALLTTTHSVAGPITVRHVAGQMAIALNRPNNGTTELALNPPELGKVRMTLKAQENAIVMMVQADRPETSDMMRRHIDVLAQEFRTLGYGNIRFEFGDGSGPQAETDDQVGTGTGQNRPDGDLGPDDMPTTVQQIAIKGALDLRL